MTSGDRISNHPRWTEPALGIHRNANGVIILETGQTREQVQRAATISEAFRLYYATGDAQPLIDLGVFPPAE